MPILKSQQRYTFLQRAFYGGCLLLLYGLAYPLVNNIVDMIFFHHELKNVAISLDYRISFLPGFIFIYHSYLVLVFAPFVFFGRCETFNRMLAAFSMNLLISCGFFLMFPVSVNHIRVNPIGDSISVAVVALTYLVDGPNNCFPSLHVSLVFLAAFFIFERNRKWGLLALGFATLVSLSTLFVRQHYIMDVFGGLAVAVLCFHLSRVMHQYRRKRRILAALRQS